ncbi:hypothetical protein HID58_027281 [Brassica napus]|uniref:Uncharacterized protein n=1 Tax=Brassica napus TaxID=3708 RepID=A0ABQ8CRA3_BRANA|nr:hypothetical protein HID58_027281 [Brassica napus]
MVVMKNRWVDWKYVAEELMVITEELMVVTAEEVVV